MGEGVCSTGGGWTWRCHIIVRLPVVRLQSLGVQTVVGLYAQWSVAPPMIRRSTM